MEGGGLETYAVARTSRKESPEALQGYHSPNMLFVVDEASGPDDIIFEVARGAMSTKGAKQVLAGNPTRPDGYFYKSHQSEAWTRFHVPCHASTQSDPSYIKEMAEEYGKDSPIYAVRVMGEFPDANPEAFIPLYIVEAAVDRDIETNHEAPVYWGFDVARSLAGDYSTLAKRQDTVLLEPIKSWQVKDSMELVGKIQLEYETAPISERPEFVFVDSIGLGGPIADRLRQLKIPAVDVNVSESPSMNDVYYKLRDELWGNGRAWFNTRKVRIPNDTKLIGQLTTPKQMPVDKIKVESKFDMKRRKVTSPDWADAFMLTFMYAGAIGAGAMMATNWNESINANMNTGWVI